MLSSWQMEVCGKACQVGLCAGLAWPGLWCFVVIPPLWLWAASLAGVWCCIL